MENKFKLKGTIIFDPKDKTSKHKMQSSWKKIAMVVFDRNSDICDYYAWFIKKRYGIVLNTPLRGPHISFINDHIRDLNGGFYNPKSSGSKKHRDEMWRKLKEKYHNESIEVILSTEIQTNGEHWWLRVEHEDRKILYDIRDEVGLPKPNLGKDSSGKLIPLGIHLTIGYAVNGRVDDEDFIDGVPKAGRMNLENSKIVYKNLRNTW